MWTVGREVFLKSCISVRKTSQIYVELYCSNTRGDCNMICWLQFDLYIKSLIVKGPILLNHYTVITALAFMIIVNKKNAVP